MRVATIVVGIVIVVASAGTHGLGNLGTLTPMVVGFTRSDISSAEGFGNGGFFGYDIGDGFKAGIEGLGFHKTANLSYALPSPESLLANRLNLAGIHDFSEGTWRLTPFVGVGFGTVDISERLLGNGIYDRATAYQLRGGVTVGMTQKLFGGFEYRWTNGSRPYLSLTGVPAKLEVNNHGFLAGVNYHF